jgi:hypothetical protein
MQHRRGPVDALAEIRALGTLQIDPQRAVMRLHPGDGPAGLGGDRRSRRTQSGAGVEKVDEVDDAPDAAGKAADRHARRIGQLGHAQRLEVGGEREAQHYPVAALDPQGDRRPDPAHRPRRG